MPHFRWNRRRTLKALGGMAAVLAAPAGPHAARPAAPAVPIARKEPVRETLWGEEVVDPYRWMENPKDPEWEPFMKGQAAHARRVLDSLPGRKALYERVTQLS